MTKTKCQREFEQFLNNPKRSKTLNNLPFLAETYERFWNAAWQTALASQRKAKGVKGGK
jgi:hypothetical protein